MAKIVTALFEKASNVQLAAQDLLNHGVCREDISIQMTQTSSGREFCVDIDSKAPEGGVIGTMIGIIAGAIAAFQCAQGYVHVPYINLAHHSLMACVLGGIAVGAVGGLVLGMLAGATIPEYESNLHPVDKRNSRMLMGVYCDEKRESEVRMLLQAAWGTCIRSQSVPTEPLRVYTTSIKDKKDAKDDFVTRASHANETAEVMKRLQTAKTSLNKIMECVSQLESELTPLASQFELADKADKPAVENSIIPSSSMTVAPSVRPDNMASSY